MSKFSFFELNEVHLITITLPILTIQSHPYAYPKFHFPENPNKFELF